MTRELDISYLDINDKPIHVVIDKFPDTCPACGKGIKVKFITAHGIEFTDYGNCGHKVQLVFKCPINGCESVFIGYYSSYFGKSYLSDNKVYLRNTFIRPFTSFEIFEEEITKLSPKFILIYNQSKTAEDAGLNEICGGGYRKSLEFLIKDFLIKVKKKSKKYVEEKSLGHLIYNDLESEKIRITAGLAKDKGNDEIHYRKTLDKLSTQDLKKLIILTTHWIVDDILTNGYKKMKNGKIPTQIISSPKSY